MKSLLMCIFILFIFAGCNKSKEGDIAYPVTSYVPILAERKSLDQQIVLTGSRELNSPGKIYFRDPYIFISETNEGVHIINNSNPSNPIKEAFIKIPGCLDIAVKGSYIYAENYTDLVVLDFSDVGAPKQVSRVNNIFPEIMPPDNQSIPEEFTAKRRPANTVIVGWRKLHSPLP